MAVDLEPYGDRFAKICLQWDKAEEDIKLAEQVAHKVVFPAIKELRYAGRRIIEALNKSRTRGQKNDVDSLLQDAEFNCLRARHDAIDAATAKVAVDLEIATNKIGYAAILAAMPNFSELHNLLNEIRDKVRKSRRNRDNREEIYEIIETTDFKALVEKYRTFQASEPIMIKLASKERFHRVINYGVGGCGVVGLIITILTLL